MKITLKLNCIYFLLKSRVIEYLYNFLYLNENLALICLSSYERVKSSPIFFNLFWFFIIFTKIRYT